MKQNVCDHDLAFVRLDGKWFSRHFVAQDALAGRKLLDLSSQRFRIGLDDQFLREELCNSLFIGLGAGERKFVKDLVGEEVFESRISFAPISRTTRTDSSSFNS